MGKINVWTNCKFFWQTDQLLQKYKFSIVSKSSLKRSQKNFTLWVIERKKTLREKREEKFIAAAFGGSLKLMYFDARRELKWEDFKGRNNVLRLSRNWIKRQEMKKSLLLIWKKKHFAGCLLQFYYSFNSNRSFYHLISRILQHKNLRCCLWLEEIKYIFFNIIHSNNSFSCFHKMVIKSLFA
jgi:hypothetical protein